MWNNNRNNIFNAFLALYLKNLENNQELVSELSSVVYHLDEANSDQEAKRVVKRHMIKYPKLPNDHSMNLQVENAGSKELFSFNELSCVNIEEVYTPEDITCELRESIKKSKPNSVYTHPDLYLKLEYKGRESFFEIELKSTKKNSIPGSSVQQIDPYGWVVFIKQGRTVKLTTGLYINSITEKMQFPDRSPRPQVAFNTLSQWNDSNFKFTEDRYTLVFNTEEICAKQQVITNWKQVLVSRWLEIIFAQDFAISSGSPWFTEAITLFAAQLLDKYENMNDIEKDIFRSRIQNALAKVHSDSFS